MNQTVVFQAFGPNHGATVVVVALVCVLLPRGMRARGSPTLRLPVGEGLGLALLGHEALKIAVLVLGYGLPLLQSLPLHLCGVSVFLNACVLLGRKFRAYEVVYFWGLGGSLMAIATPDLQYNFLHPLFHHVLRQPCLGVARRDVRDRGLRLSAATALAPSRHGRKPCLPGLMFFVNLALGTNYLYLPEKPAQPSLLDYLGPWPLYIIVMIVVGAAVMLLCYAPFAVGDWCRQRREAGRT
jgi:uncharacterized membrane protein YwaF